MLNTRKNQTTTNIKFLKTKKSILVIIYTFSLSLFAFLIIKSYYEIDQHQKTRDASTRDVVDQRINSIFLTINDFPGSASNDITFLSKLSYFKNPLNQSTIKNIQQDFLEFIKQNTAYYQLRYLDKNGYEIIRVEFDGENYHIVSEDKLQDKSWRYYFDLAMSLDANQVYISPLDLNIEHEEIENRGTSKDPIYVPVIRYAAPVVDRNGNKQGVLVANIYADYFLEDIRRYQRQGEEAFLIDQEGNYLAHADREKEFAFMFTDKHDNFYNDYPKVSQEILSDINKRSFETKDSLFSVRHIYPAFGSFETYEASKKIFGEDSEKNSHWILISVSDKKELQQASDNLKESYLSSLVLPGIIILVIFWLSFKFYRMQPNNISNNKKR